MRQTLLLLIFFFLFLQACEPNSANKTSQPPNVIVIFCDDLGYGDTGIYGHPTIQTPHIDQMAREGIKLTSFYVAAPVCTPSRAALLTGRFPIRVGMPGNQGPDSKGGLSPEERTLAEAFKQKGYRTAAFGKWHLGSTPGYFPTDHGFDEYLGLLYSNDMIPPWVNTQRPLHLYRNDQPTEEQPVDQTTLTKRYTEAAISFIRESKGQPFFIYLPHSMPHMPVYASAAFEGKSKGGRYGDVIEEIDWGVGEILGELKKQKIDENTLVIFTSDNGPWRNMPPRMFTTEPVEKWHGGTTGPLRGAKATTHEGGFRVPAILRWPGKIPPKQTSAEIATTMDLHATLLGLIEAEPAPKPLDGKNIWNLLTASVDGNDSPHQYYYYFLGNRLEGIRDREWKLRIAREADNWVSPELQSKSDPVVVQLFNLKNDPFEQFNLADEHPEIIERLKIEMRKMADDTGAELFFE
jgi:arylsulfatase A